jgi:ElaB/YqjD/DUF883 family membrane-anchored ribosome-binding protein
MALMAMTATVFADDPSQAIKSDVQSAVADVQRGAHDLGDSVRQNSRQLNHQMARSVHQFRHQFTIQWYRTSDSIHRWLQSTRDSISRI